MNKVLLLGQQFAVCNTELYTLVLVDPEPATLTRTELSRFFIYDHASAHTIHISSIVKEGCNYCTINSTSAHDAACGLPSTPGGASVFLLRQQQRMTLI